MNVLVDTSVWVSHFKSQNTQLMFLLEGDQVSTHPLIKMEIACGTPPDRTNTLRAFDKLLVTPQASYQEMLTFINMQNLFGKGCGYVDLALLASARMSLNCRLWTMDKRLHALATDMGIAYIPTLT